MKIKQRKVVVRPKTAMRRLQIEGTSGLALLVRPEKIAGAPKAVGVSTTHNGYQWSAICLRSPKEVRQLVKALQQYLRTGKQVLWRYSDRWPDKKGIYQ